MLRPTLVVFLLVVLSSGVARAQEPQPAPPPEAPPPPPAEPPAVATPPPAEQPPPPAYPPPAYYPPPGAYLPPGAYPPGDYPLGYYPEPPEELPYEEVRPIPPGYHEETQIRKGLVIAGASVFGGIYILTAIFTSVIISAEGEGEGYEALYAPLVGPWIAFGTIQDEINANGALILAASGVAQAGGVAMF